MTIKKVNKAAEVRNYVAKNPNAKPKQVSEALGIGVQYVYTVMHSAKKKAATKKRATLTLPKKLGRPRKVTEASENLKKLVEEYKQAKAAKKENWKVIDVSTSNTPTQIEMFEPKADPVNHPAHYKVGGIETIDFIEAKKLNYNIGNVVKYLTRADHKGNRKQDLEKAMWYLNREISTLK